MKPNTARRSRIQPQSSKTKSQHGAIMVRIIVMALLAIGLTPTSVPAASWDARNGEAIARADALAPSAFPASIWSAADVPVNPAGTDGHPIEVGVKFRTDADGYITGLRFYKGAANTGTHVGHLWQPNVDVPNTGTQLAEAPFTGETASGWQQVTLAAPIPVLANTTYIASYYSPSGYFASDAGYFATTGKDNPPLHALASGVDGPNGVYLADASGFPSAGSSYNYWVDVLFEANDTTPPVISSVMAAPHINTATITWSTDEAANSRVDYGIAPDALTFSTTGTARVLNHSLTLSGLTPDTTYYYRVTSRDAANNAATVPATGDPFSFTTLTFPASIWSAADVPVNPAGTDGHPIEVGVKFRTDADGYITGLRFYKGAANTGTHVGHLWQPNVDVPNTGTQLAEATFTGETASGWQQVTLAAPIPVLANTTYVASYYSPSGYFAMDTHTLASGVDSPPLHAPAGSPADPNGVYLYDASGFPSNGSDYNYWVDVVFNTTPAAPVVSMEYVSPGVVLKWRHLVASITAYEVRRNLTPYGDPASWPLLPSVTQLPTPAAIVSYPDSPGAQGNYFYLVRGANASGAVTTFSSQVGIFRFPLVPGS